MPKFEREINHKASETASFIADNLCRLTDVRLVDSSVYRSGTVSAYLMVFDRSRSDISDPSTPAADHTDGDFHTMLSLMVVGNVERCTITAIASGGGTRLDSEADTVSLVEKLTSELAGDF